MCFSRFMFCRKAPNGLRHRPRGCSSRVGKPRTPRSGSSAGYYWRCVSTGSTTRAGASTSSAQAGQCLGAGKTRPVCVQRTGRSQRSPGARPGKNACKSRTPQSGSPQRPVHQRRGSHPISSKKLGRNRNILRMADIKADRAVEMGFVSPPEVHLGFRSI
jgi:hypothetical protein